MAGRKPRLLLALGLVVGAAGCKHPSITAVSLAPHVCDARCGAHGCHEEPEGIPFYLPKPLLIVSKNFRNIEDAKVGLTDSAPIPDVFDDQSKYADLNARTNFNFGGNGTSAPPSEGDHDGGPLQSGDPTAPIDPAASNVSPAGTAAKSGAYTYSRNAPHVTPRDVPDDGLAPNTFFTYHIVFVPDMTQKYGLKVEGGVGEIRAAMNLVNGWQFTGLGPYYMKDSSTAQNIISGGIATRLGGQAVQDVLKGVAGLSAGGGKLQSSLPAGSPQVQQLARTIESLRQETHPLMTIPNYAEIHVYEARLGFDGQMEWVEIVNLAFDRHYIGGVRTEATVAPGGTPAVPTPNLQGGLPAPLGAASPPVAPSTGGIDPGLAKMAVAGVFGLPADSPALVVSPSAGALQSGLPTAAIPAGIAVPAVPAAVASRPGLHGLLSHDKHKKRGVSSTKVVTATGVSAAAMPSAVPEGIVNPNSPATSPPPPPNTGNTPTPD